ncbi:MAG: ABC transporter permease [Planctomycetota bacterium]|nr:ABC transporter permease [Planctomycetota bacterium]
MSSSQPKKNSDTRWDLGGGDLDRLLAEAKASKGESLWNDSWRRLKINRPAWWSLCFLGLFALMSVLAPLLPLRSPVVVNTALGAQSPSLTWGDHEFLNDVPTEDEITERHIQDSYWELSGLDELLVHARVGVFSRWQTGHWLGTDHLGRDLLSRLIWGSRTSILVALAATFCSLLIGVVYGAFSGLAGGRVDNLMMRVVDVLYSIPFIFVVIFLITLIGDYRMLLEEKMGLDREKVFYLVIGAIYWLTMARVVRGQVLSLKNSEFIEASRVLGASTTRILFQHIVPNVLSIVVVYLTLTIPSVMLFEAFLSFLGLGIEPPKVSWGTIAVEATSAINPLRLFWWMVVFLAMAMGSALLALNILGDGLRDALDPRMRGKD